MKNLNKEIVLKKCNYTFAVLYNFFKLKIVIFQGFLKSLFKNLTNQSYNYREK